MYLSRLKISGQRSPYILMQSLYTLIQFFLLDKGVLSEQKMAWEMCFLIGLLLVNREVKTKQHYLHIVIYKK